MKIFNTKIIANVRLNHGTFLLQVFIGDVGQTPVPGQFYNLKVSDGYYPFLRRPISICDYTNGLLTFMISNCGEGTKMLSKKKAGESLDLLGPLGNGFYFEGDYDTAIIVAGGIGVAPFPYLTRALANKKQIITFLGARTAEDLVTYNLDNIIKSTDDGTEGFKGNVIESLEEYFKNRKTGSCKIFGCGPNIMLKYLNKFANDRIIECQISTESSMACGFGLCQGCVIEKSSDGNYALICKDGPVFNSTDVVL